LASIGAWAVLFERGEVRGPIFESLLEHHSTLPCMILQPAIVPPWTVQASKNDWAKSFADRCCDHSQTRVAFLCDEWSSGICSVLVVHGAPLQHPAPRNRGRLVIAAGGAHKLSLRRIGRVLNHR
jgi:hypothetical protein